MLFKPGKFDHVSLAPCCLGQPVGHGIEGRVLKDMLAAGHFKHENIAVSFLSWGCVQTLHRLQHRLQKCYPILCSLQTD